MADDSNNKSSSFVAPISQAVIAMVAILVPVVTFVWFIMSEATGMKLDAQEIEFTYENLSFDFGNLSNDFVDLSHDFSDLSHDFDDLSNRFNLFATSTGNAVKSNTAAIQENSMKLDVIDNGIKQLLLLICQTDDPPSGCPSN